MTEDELDRWLHEASVEEAHKGRPDGVSSAVRRRFESRRDRRRWIGGGVGLTLCSIVLVLLMRPDSEPEMARNEALPSPTPMKEFDALFARIEELEARAKQIAGPAGVSHDPEQEALAKRILHLGLVLADGTGEADSITLAQDGVARLLPSTTWAEVARLKFQERTESIRAIP